MLARVARLVLLASPIPLFLSLTACSAPGGGHGDSTWSGSGGADAGNGGQASSSGGGSGGASSGGGSGSGGSSSGASGPPGCSTEFDLRNLADINKYRAGGGLAPLVLDAQICSFAQAGSQEESQDHAPHQHIINAMNDGTIWNYGFNTIAAENQGDPNGWQEMASDPTQNELEQIDTILQEMFAEGPGTGEAHSHYENIMDAQLKRVGVGLLEVDSMLYLTNDFSD